MQVKDTLYIIEKKTYACVKLKIIKYKHHKYILLNRIKIVEEREEREGTLKFLFF